MAVLFDTLKLSRRLEQAGFTHDQAVGAAEALSDAITGDLATKADIAELRAEIATLGAELRTEFRTEIAKVRTELGTEIAALRTSTAQWIIGAAFVNIVTISGAHVRGLAARNPSLNSRASSPPPRAALKSTLLPGGTDHADHPHRPGARRPITGIDLSRPLPEADTAALLAALGAHGVLCFPGQDLDAAALAGFGRRFGTLEINVAGVAHDAAVPEVMVLSNMKDAAGRPLGLNDAGQGWHTDMSYSHEIALANVLHARHVPHRHGKPLGETQFRNMHAAYDDLPEA